MKYIVLYIIYVSSTYHTKIFSTVLICMCVLISRVNGFKKQAEILRQKHAEFMEKYHAVTRGGGEGK